MRAGLKTIGLLIILSICQGCSTMKTRNRMETSASSVEHSKDLQSAVNQQTLIRQIAVLDSSEAAYKVIIYPIDSFKFSLKDGFKGMATKVELIGSIRQKKLAKDSTSLTSLDAIVRDVESVKKSNSKLSADNKTVERTPVNWRLIILLGLVVIGLVVWMRWKKENNFK